MKTKYLVLAGLLLALAVLASGCATGLAPSAWPSVAADSNFAYVAAGQYVYAVKLDTGEQQWRWPDKASLYYATPVLTSDGQLIVGSYVNKLTSLDVKGATPQINWEFTAHDRWIGGVLTVGNMIYAPNADYNLYAIDLSGTKKWAFTADQSIWGTPVTDGKTLYFGTLGRKVYAVDAATGKQVWMQKLDGAILGNLVLDQGKLYVGTFGSSLYTLNASDGKTLKQETTDSWIWSGPTLAGTNLLVGDGSGKLYSFPLSGDGQPWTQTLNGAIVGSPLVVGNDLVIGTESGNVYFVNLAGQDVRPSAVTGKVYSSPVAAGDLILVPVLTSKTDDNVLVAYDKTGAVKWQWKPSAPAK